MKNVGVPDTPLSSALITSSLTRAGVLAAAQLVAKRSGSRPSSLGVAAEVARPQLALVGEQRVVHLPELALRGRRLRRLGGELRVGCTSLRGRWRHT